MSQTWSNELLDEHEAICKRCASYEYCKEYGMTRIGIPCGSFREKKVRLLKCPYCGRELETEKT